jgi:hypothetical protein
LCCSGRQLPRTRPYRWPCGSRTATTGAAQPWPDSTIRSSGASLRPRPE